MSKEKLEQALRNWKEKYTDYEIELSINSNFAQRFEIKKRIEECRQEIERIAREIESLKEENMNENSDNIRTQNNLKKVENKTNTLEPKKKDDYPSIEMITDNYGNQLRPSTSGEALPTSKSLSVGSILKYEVQVQNPQGVELEYAAWKKHDPGSAYKWQKSNKLEINIDERDVRERLEITIRIKSKNKFHRHGEYDYTVDFYYEVKPPEQQIKYTLNSNNNFKQMEFRDRQEILGSVVFFFIPQLAEQESNIINNALISLNKILKEKLLDRGFQLRILSSIKGAIVVIPDSSNIYIHQHLLVILEDCKNQGIPVKLGITHGELEVLKDADSLFSFIGIPMNVAARLSTSDNNKGVLYDSTYINHVKPLPTSKNNDLLHPKYCNEVNISGKSHDPIFKCREPDNANLVLSQFNNDILSQLDIESDYINGIAIAYDLPKFSRGDRSELSKRFRSVIDSINSIRTRSIFPEETNQFFFSPGGDGGILILPIKLDISPSEYINLAFDLIEKLEVESDSKDSNIDVKSRVGVHSGGIILYQNAEGISRPTGLTCFIADEIASDNLAKQKGGIIITEKIKGSLFAGSLKRFEQEYESLASLERGAGKDIQRYAKK